MYCGSYVEIASEVWLMLTGRSCGMGRSVLPTVITVFGTCLLRIVWIFGVAEHYRSFKVLMAAYPVSWTLTGIMMSVAFYIFMKKLPVSRNA